MNIMHSLFLLLEHNNEALMRVALEMILDPPPSKALWWDQNWYADDPKREQFRKWVKEKLGMCLGRSREMPVVEDDDDSVSREAYEALKARLERVEGQFNAADRAKMVAEEHARSWKMIRMSTRTN